MYHQKHIITLILHYFIKIYSLPPCTGRISFLMLPQGNGRAKFGGVGTIWGGGQFDLYIHMWHASMHTNIRRVHIETCVCTVYNVYYARVHSCMVLHTVLKWGQPACLLVQSPPPAIAQRLLWPHPQHIIHRLLSQCSLKASWDSSPEVQHRLDHAHLSPLSNYITNTFLHYYIT